MVDHHVDRPGVQARRRVQLTGTNRSFGLIALIFNAHRLSANDPKHRRQIESNLADVEVGGIEDLAKLKMMLQR